MRCYFSTGAFQSRNLAEILEMAVHHGLDVELSSAVEYCPDIPAYLEPARGRIRFLVHNYFPPPSQPFVLNLASADQGVHTQSVELCKTAIDLCSLLEAPFYSVHAGFAFHLAPQELGDPNAQGSLSSHRLFPRDEALARFTETTHQLIEYATSKGIALLLENNVMARENLDSEGQSPLLLADIQEIKDFFRELGDPRAGLLLDTGHAKVTANTLGIPMENYLEDLKPLIRGLHLSDNDGRKDTNQPFDKNVWFAPYLRELASLPMVIEVNRMSIDEMLEQRKVLENILR